MTSTFAIASGQPPLSASKPQTGFIPGQYQGYFRYFTGRLVSLTDNVLSFSARQEEFRVSFIPGTFNRQDFSFRLLPGNVNREDSFVKLLSEDVSRDIFCVTPGKYSVRVQKYNTILQKFGADLQLFPDKPQCYHSNVQPYRFNRRKCVAGIQLDVADVHLGAAGVQKYSVTLHLFCDRAQLFSSTPQQFTVNRYTVRFISTSSLKLTILDGLVENYRRKNPEFWNAYFSARKLVNYGIRHEKKDDRTVK